MAMTNEELMMVLQQLEQAVNSGQQLTPELQQIYDAAAAKGLIKSQSAQNPNTRQQVADALRQRPSDFRPVERNKAGGFAPPMAPGGMGFNSQSGGMEQAPPQIASHRYGGTMASGAEGVPPSPMDPNELMMHYAEQNALKEAGQPIGDTMVSQGRRVTAPADTEVRPWAQRTPAGYKDRGLDPSQAPLQPVAKSRGAPNVYPAAATVDEEAILRQIMGMQ